MTLARQGQQLIEAFQAGGHGGRKVAPERPGGSNINREGDASGADRPSGSGQPSGAEGGTNPR